MNRLLLRLLAPLAPLLFSLTAVGAAATDVVDLAALRGRVVYVDFWASWCVPCRQSFPYMNEVHREFAKDGLVIVAVNVDQDRAEADAFLRRYPPDFRIAFDTGGTLAERFHVKGMPTSFLIDRAGNVRMQHQGFRPDDRGPLRDEIRRLLSAP
ncbi:MAG: TlpA family protein disulfide reductase [Proteobacteria bacterium]|nr:TlpA family protein disulfide reductase [Pseudomonadota bacterium]